MADDGRYKFFTKDDLNELLLRNGLIENKNVFLEPGVSDILLEMAHGFVEETLDTYKHKKRELSVEDIKKSIAMKFPQVSTEYQNDNHAVLQAQSKEMDQIDERVREVEKKAMNKD